VKCNYCNSEAVYDSGLLDSREDSPEVEFWRCPDCSHAWMDNEQEERLKRAEKGLLITSKPTEPW
jgi:Zn-finger nucleic acid-binding protein